MDNQIELLNKVKLLEDESARGTAATFSHYLRDATRPRTLHLY